MKKKILVALFAAVLICLFALTVSAANEVTLTDGTTADIGTVFKIGTTKDGVVQIVGFNSGYDKNMVTDVIFPDEIDGLEANFLFGSSTSIKTITFGATDEFFISGDNIFTSCSVEKITFDPNCIVEIRKGNFSGCTSLTEITFPKFRKITGSSFHGCNVMVPTNDLILVEGLTEIGGHAFHDCTGITGTLVFPSTLEKIYEYSFQNTGIEYFDLSKCARLSLVGGGFGGPFTDNDNITTLDLSGCIALKDLNGSFAANCDNLVNVILPPNLENIPHKAFAHCYKLQSIVLPSSMKTVADEAFHSARSGQDVGTFTVYVQSDVVFHDPHAFRDSGAKIEFVLIGDGVTLESFTAANTYAHIKGATVVDYKDASNPYAYTVGQTISNHTIVVNYCKSLALDGMHKNRENPCVDYCVDCELSSPKESPQHELTTVITYANGYMQIGTVSVECENTGCLHKITSDASPLFSSKGYSREEASNAILLDFKVDKEAISAYESYLGEKISYGVVAAKALDSYEGSLINSDGTGKDGVISFAFEKTDFALLQLKLSGISEKDEALYCCGYIVVCGEVVYVNGAQADKTALAISYNELENNK